MTHPSKQESTEGVANHFCMYVRPKSTNGNEISIFAHVPRISLLGLTFLSFSFVSSFLGMEAMEKPVCFLKVNDNDIPIFDFDDPVWRNPENFFPVEFFPVIERPISEPEVKQDEAGLEAVQSSSNNFDLSDYIIPAEQQEVMHSDFRLENFLVPVNTVLQGSKTALSPTVDIGKISFIIFPAPTDVMITIKGVRYTERLCLDVFEFLTVFKFIFSDQCFKLKEDGLIYGTEENRKQVLDLSKPEVVVFSPTLHAHWIKLYGTLHLRLVRHGRNSDRAQCVYLNAVNIGLLHSVGVEAVLRKIITFQDSFVDLPEFFPILIFLYDDGTTKNRNFHLLDQLIIHSESNWRGLIGHI